MSQLRGPAAGARGGLQPLTRHTAERPGRGLGRKSAGTRDTEGLGEPPRLEHHHESWDHRTNAPGGQAHGDKLPPRSQLLIQLDRKDRGMRGHKANQANAAEQSRRGRMESSEGGVARSEEAWLARAAPWRRPR